MKRLCMALMVLGIGVALLVGCNAQTRVQTIAVTAEQVKALEEIAHVAPCADGKIDAAGLVRYPSGGGIVTVRCDVGGIFK